MQFEYVLLRFATDIDELNLEARLKAPQMLCLPLRLQQFVLAHRLVYVAGLYIPHKLVS